MVGATGAVMEPRQKKRAGQLIVAASGMFTGKSGILCEEGVKATRAGERIGAFTHVENTRDDMITSKMHTARIPVKKIRNAFEIFENISPQTEDILIDEAQFFGPEIVPVVKILHNAGMNIVVAGLDLTSEGTPFGHMPELLAMSDNPDKPATICKICKSRFARKSFYTGAAPKTEDVKVVKNGVDTEVYQARCNEHWSFQFTAEEKATIEGLSAEIKSAIQALEESNIKPDNQTEPLAESVR